MQATIASLNSSTPEQTFLQARNVISAGEILAYPTDTFYALGVDPKNRDAIKRLFAIKNRYAGQPILLLISDLSKVVTWAQGIGESEMRFMKRYWPGPVTFVLRAQPDVPEELTAGSGTIGLRVPGNALTRRLLEAVGGCLTGTSANISGRPEARTAGEVLETIGKYLEMILDGGSASVERPSTVVDISGQEPKITRQGAVQIDLG